MGTRGWHGGHTMATPLYQGSPLAQEVIVYGGGGIIWFRRTRRGTFASLTPRFARAPKGGSNRTALVPHRAEHGLLLSSSRSPTASGGERQLIESAGSLRSWRNTSPCPSEWSRDTIPTLRDRAGQRVPIFSERMGFILSYRALLPASGVARKLSARVCHVEVARVGLLLLRCISLHYELRSQQRGAMGLGQGNNRYCHQPPQCRAEALHGGRAGHRPCTAPSP